MRTDEQLFSPFSSCYDFGMCRGTGELDGQVYTVHSQVTTGYLPVVKEVSLGI